MLKIEKRDNIITLVIELNDDLGVSLAETVLDCLSWIPAVRSLFSYEIAWAIIRGEKRMKNGDSFYLLGELDNE